VFVLWVVATGEEVGGVIARPADIHWLLRREIECVGFLWLRQTFLVLSYHIYKKI